MSKLLTLCQKVVAYSNAGDPIKDAVETGPWTQDELLVELASHYVAFATGNIRLDLRTKERADL